MFINMLNSKQYCCYDTKEFGDRKIGAHILSSSYYVHPCTVRVPPALFDKTVKGLITC